MDTNADLFAFAVSSRSLRVGGKGGNFACSNGGGNFLPTCVSGEEALVAVDTRPSDIPDIVELTDAMEEFEPRLVNCVDVFRGGRAGEACDPFLPGNGGGRFRAGKEGDRAVEVGLSRSTGGGGRRFFTPVGWLLVCLVTEEPYVTIGGLLMVWFLDCKAGLFDEEVGIGGGGLLPKVVV